MSAAAFVLVLKRTWITEKSATRWRERFRVTRWKTRSRQGDMRVARENIGDIVNLGPRFSLLRFLVTRVPSSRPRIRRVLVVESETRCRRGGSDRGNRSFLFLRTHSRKQTAFSKSPRVLPPSLSLRLCFHGTEKTPYGHGGWFVPFYPLVVVAATTFFPCPDARDARDTTSHVALRLSSIRISDCTVYFRLPTSSGNMYHVCELSYGQKRKSVEFISLFSGKLISRIFFRTTEIGFAICKFLFRIFSCYFISENSQI